MELAEKTQTLLQYAGRALTDFVLPPRCAGCGVEIEHQDALCPTCWQQLTFISRPLCECCGVPFEIAPVGDSICGNCLADPPQFRASRSALIYDEECSPYILKFKHGDRLSARGLLSQWLYGAGGALLAEAGFIVPVPLNWTRLLKRRYNQAAILALSLSKLSGTPALVDGLIRRKATSSQGRKSAAARARNVQAAFEVNPKRAEKIKGARILLLDDVLASGATTNSCCKTLLKGGARSVDFLTIERVLR